MALSQEQLKTVKELKSQGYSQSQVLSFFGANEMGRSNSTIHEEERNQVVQKEDEEQSLFQRITSDIPENLKQSFGAAKEAFAGGRETAAQAREQVTSGEITPVAGTVKTIGGGLKAGAETLGAGLMGLVKTPFTPEAEKATAEKVREVGTAIAETEPVQATISKYEQLDPEQKAIVDGLLGTTEGLATILGAGPAVRAAKTAVTTPASAVGRGLTRLNEATAELGDINLPSIEGINLAKQAGLAPEDLMQRVARVSKGKQAKFEERAGESIGQYLVDRNIFGTPDQIVEQLYSRMKDSKGRVDASLDTIKGEFKAPQVSTALDELFERDTKVSTQGALSPDSKRIEELWRKNKSKGLNISEVNEVKRMYERNVKLDYLRDNVSDKIDRANNIDNALRNLIENKATKAGVSTVKELNRETFLAKQLMDDLGAEYAGSAGNNAIGLTDALFLSEALGSANPVAAAGFLAKKGLGSKTVMSKLAEKTSATAGSKAALPEVPPSEGLTGYLRFLAESNQSSQ